MAAGHASAAAASGGKRKETNEVDVVLLNWNDVKARAEQVMREPLPPTYFTTTHEFHDPSR